MCLLTCTCCMSCFHANGNLWWSRNERFAQMSCFLNGSFLCCIFVQGGWRCVGGGAETGEEKPHIKSDYIVSLMEQFASQFCQHHAVANSQEHNVCGLPSHQAPFLSPSAPFNFITPPADTYTLCVSASHTQQLMMTDTLLSEKREASRSV